MALMGNLVKNMEYFALIAHFIAQFYVEADGVFKDGVSCRSTIGWKPGRNVPSGAVFYLDLFFP